MEQGKQATEAGGKFCEQCGTPALPAARFCGMCGADMISGLPVGQTQVFAEPGLVEEGEEGSGAPIGIGTAWLVYLAALGFWLGALSLLGGSVAAAVYFVAGFVMTRVLMRGLIEFHPVHNTLANVFSAKIWMFLLWPIQMLVLLLKLSINRVL
ncbi:MAG: zinc ribbon domain-containing protein [Burkholderiaceae bacterium]|nr:zinc ribbon domain-containing protein [Burkholderiaceae bacterium]